MLVAGARRAGLVERLEALGRPHTAWARRMGEVGEPTPWPLDGTWSAGLLRLPRDASELLMHAHAVGARLAPGGPAFLYGANDEGIKSAARRLLSVWGSGQSVAVGGHCRVLRFPDAGGAAPDRADQRRWRRESPCPVPGRNGTWVSYPGVFGHRAASAGGLDPGTHALLDALANLSPVTGAVLDYGTGAGSVAAFLTLRARPSRLDLVDVDALALDAARENVPGGNPVLSDRVPEGKRYDLIVSNPPYHEGKAESRSVLTRLLEDTPGHLKPGGRLVFVTQRRFAASEHAERHGLVTSVLLDDGPFRVWEGRVRPVSARSR